MRTLARISSRLSIVLVLIVVFSWLLTNLDPWLLAVRQTEAILNEDPYFEYRLQLYSQQGQQLSQILTLAAKLQPVLDIIVGLEQISLGPGRTAWNELLSILDKLLPGSKDTFQTLEQVLRTAIRLRLKFDRLSVLSRAAYLSQNFRARPDKQTLLQLASVCSDASQALAEINPEISNLAYRIDAINRGLDQLLAALESASKNPIIGSLASSLYQEVMKIEQPLRDLEKSLWGLEHQINSDISIMQRIETLVTSAQKFDEFLAQIPIFNEIKELAAIVMMQLDSIISIFIFLLVLWFVFSIGGFLTRPLRGW